MENYNELITKLSNEVISQLREFLPGKTCKFKFGGEATIDKVEGELINNNIIDFIICANEKRYCLRYIFNNGIVKFDEDTTKKLNDIFEKVADIDKVVVESIKYQEQENERLRLEKIKADKLEAEALKRKAKFNSQRDSAIRSAESLPKAKFNLTNDFFVELGYIAKHAKHIYAAMPDYLERWFTSEFGDVERKVVDTSKKTPSGLPPQFALSLKINLDTNDNIPDSLTKRFSTAKVSAKARAIADTSYVFTLCSKYGFKFGTEQDIDEIFNHIPENMLDSFKLGYELA